MSVDRAQILITAVDQTRTALASVKSNLEGLSIAAQKVSGVLAGLGVALSVSALASAGKAALDAADELSKLSQKTGISVESLSLLKPVAEQSGVSLDGLARGIQKLSTAMVEASGGSKEQVQAFDRLKVAVTDSAAQLRPTEDVLLDLAEAFAGMPDGAEKSALAIKIFGKSGVELIPFLNQGREGIEELKQQFKALGLEISGDTARAAEKFNDTLDTVAKALQAIAMKVAQAALPALQKLADALVSLASHGDELMAGLRVLGEVVVTVLALKGVGAVAKLLAAFGVLRAAMMRFLPVLAAVALWEMGRGIVNMVQDIRDSNRAIEDWGRSRERLHELSAAMQELASTGALSVKTQMWLAAQAAERLRDSLPGASDALSSIQGAAILAGEAIGQSFEAEAKRAAETARQMAESYKRVAADIKALWDARITDIEANFKRQEAAAQLAARSESAGIRETTQTLVAAEREKRAAIEAGAQQMESVWRSTFAQAVVLARAAGQDVQAVERQAVDARIALYGQLESAYRASVERLIAEEQRHLQAAKVAEEARLNLRLSVQDRIRELSRKGMDEQAAYQDRLRQIDEKQAQARAALAAGNFDQARKLAEESIALAERSASAVTRQVELNGRTITQTVVSDASAAAAAIAQIQESAGIADAALQGLGDAHRVAANAAAGGADDARRALGAVIEELARLRQQLLVQDKLKLDVDLESARVGIDKLKALATAQELIAKVQVDTKEAQASLEKFKADTQNLALVAKVQADTARVLGDIAQIKGTLSAVSVDIPAMVSFDQPRAQLAAFAQDAQTVLAAPTQANHTVRTDLSQYRAALSELLRPTSSNHTIYVQKVYANAQGGLIQRLAAGGQLMAQVGSSAMQSGVAAGFRRLSGRIYGPGTETSDSVPALLSHGEFVVRAASVRKFGEKFFAALNAGFLPAIPRFAGGGGVDSGMSNLVNSAAVQMTMASAMAGNSTRDTATYSATDTATERAREVVDLRFHVGGASHTLQTSRQTAMQLAQALREISRGQ